MCDVVAAKAAEHATASRNPICSGNPDAVGADILGPAHGLDHVGGVVETVET